MGMPALALVGGSVSLNAEPRLIAVDADGGAALSFWLLCYSCSTRVLTSLYLTFVYPNMVGGGQCTLAGCIG